MFGFLKKLFGGGNEHLQDAIERGAIIIDVRSPAEYAQGHVKGSVNVPLQMIGGQINQIKKYKKPVITCCRSGMRSGNAAGQLKSAGIEVYNGGSWGAVQRLTNS
ncbi:MAG: rhodanese-like domain-containing protein [Aureispira sp.]|nr:rhodanese-like domain-containing protein [Aureispira sp.]